MPGGFPQGALAWPSFRPLGTFLGRHVATSGVSRQPTGRRRLEVDAPALLELVDELYAAKGCWPEDESVPRSRLAGRRCVFCGAPKVSREHVIPQWVGKVLRRTATVEKFLYTQSASDGRRRSPSRTRPLSGRRNEYAAAATTAGWNTLKRDAESSGWLLRGHGVDHCPGFRHLARSWGACLLWPRWR